MITADPDSWYRADPAVMGAQNHTEFRAATRDPRVVRAMLGDYRRGLGIDADHERADRAAGRRLAMPTLIAWSEFDDLEELFGDPPKIWRAWADDVTGIRIPSEYHMAEEAPEALTDALIDFLLPG